MFFSVGRSDGKTMDHELEVWEGGRWRVVHGWSMGSVGLGLEKP